MPANIPRAEKTALGIVIGLLGAGGVGLFLPFPISLPIPSPGQYFLLAAATALIVNRAAVLENIFTTQGRARNATLLDIAIATYCVGLFCTWYSYSPPFFGPLFHKTLLSISPGLFYFTARFIYLTPLRRSYLANPNSALDEVLDRCGERTLTCFGENDVDYSNYCERIEQIVSTRHDCSLTLGLTGRWGIGKSSIIRIVRSRIEAKGIIVCYQSAWDYRNPSNVLEGILAALKDEVHKHVYVPQLEDYIDRITAQLLGDRYGWIKDVLGNKGALSTREIAASIDAVLSEAELQVVLILDDIDRLDAQECAAIFRGIHLLNELTRVTKIIVYDRVRLSYFADPERSDEDNFIQKIIDIELSIPTPSEEDTFRLFHYCTAPLNFGEEDRKRFSALFNQQSQKIFYAHLRTPRDIKRVALRVAFVWSELGSNSNLFDVFVLSILHEIHPRLYRAIFDFPHLFYHSDWADDLHLTLDRELNTKKIFDQRNKLLADFPEAVDLLGTIFPDVLATEEKKAQLNVDDARAQRRIYHPDIFERYFRTDISGDLIPEKQYEDIADQFLTLEPENQIELVKALFINSAKKRAIASLFKGWPLFKNRIIPPRAQSVETDRSIRSVFLGIARASAHLNCSNSSLGFLSDRNHAAHTALPLIAQCTDDKAATGILRAAIEESSSIGFCDGIVFYSCDQQRGAEVFRQRKPHCGELREALRLRVEAKYRDHLTTFFEAEKDEQIVILCRLDTAQSQKIVSASLACNYDKLPLLLRHFTPMDFSDPNFQNSPFAHIHEFNQLTKIFTVQQLKGHLALIKEMNIKFTPYEVTMIQFFSEWVHKQPAQ